MYMIAAVERLIAKVGRQLEVVYLSFTSKKVGLLTKVLIAMFFFYAASPIDVIPDAIPFFGALDDLVVVPLAYGIAKATIKQEVWDEIKLEADENVIEIDKKYKIIGGCIVGTLTIALFVAILLLIL